MKRSLLAALLLAGCGQAPCPPVKPDIPDDLQLVCVDGHVVAYSQAAQQVMKFPRLPCRTDRDI